MLRQVGYLEKIIPICTVSGTEMFQEKMFAEKIKTHVLCSRTFCPLPESRAFCEIIWKKKMW